MRTVRKHDLQAHVNSITVNQGARVVHVGLQDGTSTAWVETDTGKPEIQMTLHIVATGDEVPNGGHHVGYLLTEYGGEHHVYDVPVRITPMPRSPVVSW